MTKPAITQCPTCGSRKMRRVRRDVDGVFRGKAYLAKNVEYEECPVCDERLYDLAAMEKLEAARKTSVPSRRRVA